MCELSEVERDFLSQGEADITFHTISTVERLEDRGLLTATWFTQPGDHKNFGHWRITDAGRAALTAPEPPAVAFECSNSAAVRVMEAHAGRWRCPFCGWRSEAVPEPSLVCGKCGASIEIALHTDAGWFTVTHVCPQCGVVAQYGEKDQAEAAEERADNAERKLAAEREAHRALVAAAEELPRAALAVHDNGGQPRDSDWLRVDNDSVVDLGRAAEDCRDALAALEENNRE